MEEEVISIKDMLSQDLEKAITKLTSQGKDHALVGNYSKEYYDLDRKIRDTQVGNIQTDKTIGEGSSQKLVKAIRTPVNFAKKIVTTACAFEVGEPVTLTPSIDNDLFKELMRLWKTNRMDSKIQDSKTIQKVETESAIHFFIRKNTGSTKVTQPEGATLDIRSNVLKYENGLMFPYFDASNDMIAFTWQFTSQNSEGKDINNTWVFDQLNVYKISNASGSVAIDNEEPHGFDRIPIVYMQQKYPEWYDVELLIDRYEVALSKLGAANDYSGHPILLTYGDFGSLPDKMDDGKTLNFPIVFKDDDITKPYNGDAKFLTRDNAPEAVKLEMETIRELIYSITQTPDISFEKMKSIGAISGVALRLMFLDPIIKAKMNEGQNRTIIERAINILISGITGAVNVASKTQTNELIVDVSFNSILPEDLLENSAIVLNAFSSQSMSTKERVKQLGVAYNVDEEVSAIEKEFATAQTTAVPPTQ